jgi:hypothetical protein
LDYNINLNTEQRQIRQENRSISRQNLNLNRRNPRSLEEERLNLLITKLKNNLSSEFINLITNSLNNTELFNEDEKNTVNFINNLTNFISFILE